MMDSHTTSGIIVWDDKNGAQYRICRLDCTTWDDDSYEYAFTPDYRVIDMLDEREYGGIPGLDLDLRRDVYIRKNMEPVFMTERSPSRNRVDLWDLLESVGLNHYDRLEWLIRTKLRYSGDALHVIRYEEPPSFEFSEGICKDSDETCRMILKALATGGDVSICGMSLDDHSASAVGRTLKLILDEERRKNPLKTVTKVGRKKKDLSVATLSWARDTIRTESRTADVVAADLGVSKSLEKERFLIALDDLIVIVEMAHQQGRVHVMQLVVIERFHGIRVGIAVLASVQTCVVPSDVPALDAVTSLAHTSVLDVTEDDTVGIADLVQG